MECKIKNRHELISNYMMRELPDDKAKNFEEHYFHCETCFKELKAAEDAINLIRHEGPTLLTKESSKHKNFGTIIHKFTFANLSVPKRWGIAFASIAAVVVVLLLTLRNDQKILDDKVISKDEETFPEGQFVPLNKDTITQKDNSQNKNDFAELTGPSFKTVTYLEEWVTENVRSDDLIDSVFSPGIGVKFYDSKITFQWKMNKVLEGITIKIMNNLEKEIFKSTLDNDQFPKFTFQANPEIFKQSGLYYWRLEDENEVLYVGKFYFLK